MGTKQRMSWDDIMTMITEMIDGIDLDDAKAILKVLIPSIEIEAVEGDMDSFDVTIEEPEVV